MKTPAGRARNRRAGCDTGPRRDIAPAVRRGPPRARAVQSTFVKLAALSIVAAPAEKRGRRLCRRRDALRRCARGQAGTAMEPMRARSCAGTPGRIDLVTVAPSMSIWFCFRRSLRVRLRAERPISCADGGSGGAPLVIDRRRAVPPGPRRLRGHGVRHAELQRAVRRAAAAPRSRRRTDLAWDGSTFHYLTVCGGARCAEAAAVLPGVYDLRFRSSIARSRPIRGSRRCDDKGGISDFQWGGG